MAINMKIIDIRSCSPNKIIGATIKPGIRDKRLPKLNNLANIRAFFAGIIFVFSVISLVLIEASFEIVMVIFSVLSGLFSYNLLLFSGM